MNLITEKSGKTPKSEWMRRTQPVRQLKTRLRADSWIERQSQPLDLFKKQLADYAAEMLSSAFESETLEKKMHASEDIDEWVSYRILANAMETPIRALLAKAGFNPDSVLSQIALAVPGFGFDVFREQVLDMNQAGIQDSVSVIQAAILRAIHGVALARVHFGGHAQHSNLEIVFSGNLAETVIDVTEAALSHTSKIRKAKLP